MHQLFIVLNLSFYPLLYIFKALPLSLAPCSIMLHPPKKLRSFTTIQIGITSQDVYLRRFDIRLVFRTSSPYDDRRRFTYLSLVLPTKQVA